MKLFTPYTYLIIDNQSRLTNSFLSIKLWQSYTQWIIITMILFCGRSNVSRFLLRITTSSELNVTALISHLNLIIIFIIYFNFETLSSSILHITCSKYKQYLRHAVKCEASIRAIESLQSVFSLWRTTAVTSYFIHINYINE